MSKRKGISYAGRNTRNGWLFITPWLLGFAVFFAIPLLQTVLFSVSRLVLSGDGYTTRLIGFQHYIDAFVADLEFPRTLLESVGNMLVTVPVIVMFAMFLALLINQRYRGRTLVRAIFFLPVVVASSVAMSMIGSDSFSKAMKSGSEALGVFKASGMQDLLREYGLSVSTISAVTGFINSSFDLLWKCGVQVLLFLAGLQSISDSLYEAASVEGATGWEKFWKITFPMLTPVTLLCLVYLVIDSFTDYGNAMIRLLYGRGLTQLKYDSASALSVIYTVAVLLIIGAVFLLTRKAVFYQVDE